jgi:L-2-hydroxyglutarate oxidase LhgO
VSCKRKSENLPEKAEILIVGGGIIGLTIARELVRKGVEDIVILEKESEPGRHASGRNSGVLHAGIYYAPDSFKAGVCLKGNFLMRRYCREKGIKLLETGKTIVARNENEVLVLEELQRRAIANNAWVEMIDEKTLSEIEPNAKTAGKALFSHYTAMLDPRQVINALKNDILKSGNVSLITGTTFKALRGDRKAVTTKGAIEFNILVNAAGAYCDKIAHMFGIGRNYRILPFKGVYWQLKPGAPYTVNGNIYPVPDIRNPFLGVHFTRHVNDEILLGPTAIPAFGRENYGILCGIDAEAPGILWTDIEMMIKNPKFRQVALTEPGKYMKPFFYKDAARLVKKLSPHDLVPSDKVGIRAQLLDINTHELVMDFLVKSDGNAIHILNPISPAFTSSMAIAETIVESFFNI